MAAAIEYLKFTVLFLLFYISLLFHLLFGVLNRVYSIYRKQSLETKQEGERERHNKRQTQAAKHTHCVHTLPLLTHILQHTHTHALNSCSYCLGSCSAFAFAWGQVMLPVSLLHLAHGSLIERLFFFFLTHTRAVSISHSLSLCVCVLRLQLLGGAC